MWPKIVYKHDIDRKFCEIRIATIQIDMST